MQGSRIKVWLIRSHWRNKQVRQISRRKISFRLRLTLLLRTTTAPIRLKRNRRIKGWKRGVLSTKRTVSQSLNSTRRTMAAGARSKYQSYTSHRHARSKRSSHHDANSTCRWISSALMTWLNDSPKARPKMGGRSEASWTLRHVAIFLTRVLNHHRINQEQELTASFHHRFWVLTLIFHRCNIT